MLPKPSNQRRRPENSPGFWECCLAARARMRSRKALGMSWPSKLRTTARTSGTLVRKTCSSSGSRSSNAVSSGSSFHGFSCAHQHSMTSAPGRHVLCASKRNNCEHPSHHCAGVSTSPAWASAGRKTGGAYNGVFRKVKDALVIVCSQITA